MRFFRREAAQLPDFWSWWAGARDRVAQAVDAGAYDRALIEEVSRAVQSVDPRLAWEFAPGRTSRHALCVTPEGNPEARPAALRWLAAAPPADATWEYHAARQASPGLSVLELGGIQVNLADMRVVASRDDVRRRIDVHLWHPAFERAPEPIRLQAAFLFLDNLLGEDDVERWIGKIDVLEAPVVGRTPQDLRAEVERLAATPAGDETWIIGQLSGPRGEPIVVTADAALKRIDHPFADQHVAIHIPIEGGGMPSDADATMLNAEEDRLVGLLGDAATLAGRTTTPGERVIHLVAADLDPVKAAIEAWAEALPPWRLGVDLEHDPAWSFRAALGLG